MKSMEYKPKLKKIRIINRNSYNPNPKPSSKLLPGPSLYIPQSHILKDPSISYSTNLNMNSKYKDKMEDYAYAMNKVTSLYEKACTTISEYVQSGLLIREFSDSRIAYDDFQNTWKDLQFRKYIRTYKLGDIVNEPEELKFLFGTSDMGFLSEIFSKIEA